MSNKLNNDYVSMVVAFTKNACINTAFDTLNASNALSVEYYKRVCALVGRNGIIVLGRITWDALSEDVITTLKDAVTAVKKIVIVSTTSQFHHDPDAKPNSSSVQFVTPNDIDKHLESYGSRQEVYILGGESIYAMFIDRTHRIYVSIIDQPQTQTQTQTQTQSKFPISKLQNFDIVHFSDAKHIVYERRALGIRGIRGIRGMSCIPGMSGMPAQHGEHAYLNLATEIYSARQRQGNNRKDRTNVGTIAVFGRQMRFNISNSIPLLTTKTMGWTSIIEELLWFMKGQTDSKILEQKKIPIWKGNTTREFLDRRGLTHYKEGDIGPMYGFQWRHMGAEYEGADHDYTDKGLDQIKWLIESLKTDPYSRRHMITTYNPLDVDKGVLAPCHGIVAQFFVEDGENNKKKRLSCHVYNRSQDTFLGMPYNIFSYAVMTHIIAKFTDMTPHELIVSTGDTHLYTNHLEQMGKQLERPPFPFPVLSIKDDVVKRPNGIDDLTIDDFQVVGYIRHPPIRAPMAV